VGFEKNGYSLYARRQEVRGRRFQTIYFFSKRKPIVGEPVDLPEGYMVALSRKSGVPFLSKQ
jgi:hypothetical protein